MSFWEEYSSIYFVIVSTIILAEMPVVWSAKKNGEWHNEMKSLWARHAVYKVWHMVNTDTTNVTCFVWCESDVKQNIFHFITLSLYESVSCYIMLFIECPSVAWKYDKKNAYKNGSKIWFYNTTSKMHWRQRTLRRV